MSVLGRSDKLLVVTAFDESHRLEAHGLLHSVHRHLPKAQVLIFALEMLAAIDLATLKAACGVEVRAFDWARWAPSLHRKLYGCGWKPTVVRVAPDKAALQVVLTYCGLMQACGSQLMRRGSFRRQPRLGRLRPATRSARCCSTRIPECLVDGRRYEAAGTAQARPQRPCVRELWRRRRGVRGCWPPRSSCGLRVAAWRRRALCSGGSNAASTRIASPRRTRGASRVPAATGTTRALSTSRCSTPGWQPVRSGRAGTSSGARAPSAGCKAPRRYRSASAREAPHHGTRGRS